MISFDFLGIAVLLLFLGLLIGFAAFGHRWPMVLRPLRGFDELNTAIERAVEAGERVHLSLGTGSVIGSDSAPALAGLAMLSRIATATTMSDKPVVVTAGDGAMALLAQDTLRAAYERAKAGERFQPISGRMLGPTPFSYVASLPILISTEDVSVHLLAGSFGAEGALAADFGERQEAFVLAGTDDAQSQALLYVTAEHPLIGEEVFAGGAYLNVGPFHLASLRTQDMVRVLIVALILIGTILSTLGVNL
ncbi:MAG: hypothetical protein JSV37_09580 [Anaerolineaceae bacterium]|nr:MAG: hypothetical protein JSV37_09580 [Anaerolineaceae bacterium]